MLKILGGLLAFSLVTILICVGVYVVIASVFGRIFKLAGQPSLAAFVPVYNVYTFCKIVFGSGLYCIIPFITLFLPEKLASVVFGLFWIVAFFLLGKVFNRGILFTIGLIIPFTSPIFILLLALSDSQYSGKASAY